MKLGDQAHDIKSQAQVRGAQVRGAGMLLRAHGKHRSKELALHFGRKRRTIVADLECNVTDFSPHSNGDGGAPAG